MNPISLSAADFSWLPILPMAVVAIGAIVVLLAGVHVDDSDSDGLGWLAIATLFLALLLTFGIFGQTGFTFAGAIAMDSFTAYFDVVVLLATMMTVLMSIDYAGRNRMPGAEYYSLIMFSALGMMMMAGAGDLIVIFIGLETMSIAVYVLAGMARRDPKSNEAAIKYFLLGAFSTGFLLYGIALIYGATGTIKIGPLAAAIASGSMNSNALLLPGVGLLLIGFGFKVAAVPFHMWAPDVYEGAPTPVTAFMAVGVKLAAFAGLLRVFLIALGPAAVHWSLVVAVIAALTMTVGNLLAVVQSGIKRMLAYSAIAHAGYLLVGVAAGAGSGGAILYYLLAYSVANLGAFGVVLAIERTGEIGSGKISGLRGLSSRSPMLAAAMTVFMLSLTGVPPLAGFAGKFYLFNAALNQGYTGLVIIGVLNSAVSAYYYFSVLVAMYMQEGGAEESEVRRARPALAAAIGIAALATIAIGMFPQSYIASAENAFHSAAITETQRAVSLAQ
ncbi:MAG TPA: NADH-quinone oxidoreductase subunit N [Candidatus Binataceae bacterium]|nr:NADH-quinone oxidoreductase subunit N [Candidatus Binataceae bacterium]